MGGSSKKQTVGYKYYLGAHLVICHGPVDSITEIQVDRRIAWQGNNTGGPLSIDKPFLFGGDAREGGVSGDVNVLMGRADQMQDNYLVQQLGENVPGYRGVVSLILNQTYMGNNPYIKPWAITASRINITSGNFTQWNNQKATIFRETDFSEQCLPYECDALEAQDPNWRYYIYGSEPDFADVFPIPGVTPRGFGGAEVTDFNSEHLPREPVFLPDAIVPCGIDPEFIYAVRNFGYLEADNANATVVSAIVAGTAGPPGATMHQVNVTGELTNPGGAIFQSFVGGLGGLQPSDFGVFAGGSTTSFEWEGTGDQRFQDAATKLDLTSGDGIEFVITRFEFEYLGTGLGFPQFNPATQYLYLRFSVSHQVGNINNPVSSVIDVLRIYLVPDATGTRGVANLEFNFIALTGNGNRERNVAAIKVGAEEDFPGFIDDLFGFRRNIPAYEIPNDCPECNDMNPAHIIRECLTDSVWGMGYNDADIDDTAFEAAADTLFDEDMGISILWEREQPLEDFIGEILRHIDAVLYVSRVTGRFVLKLIREESAALTLDESNVSSVTDAKRPTVSELTNAVTVIYWDHVTEEEAGVTIHNEALRQIQGVEIGTTVQYPGFTNSGLASRVAERDLKALSTPLLSCTVEASRAAAELNVGDVVRLDWPDLSINTDMRINTIDLGDGIDNSITLELIQDVFTTPSAARTGQQTTGWIDPLAGEPLASIGRIVTESPYYALVLDQSERVINDILTDDPDAGFLLVAGGRQGNEFDATISVDSGSGFTSAATMDFSPTASLTDNIRQTDSTLYYESGKDIDEIDTPAIAQIGEELIKVTGSGADSNGTFLTVGRGILDTTPKEHTAGSVITVWGDYAESDDIQYAPGEGVDVQITTQQNTTALESPPTDSVTFASRAIRPYPPGNLQVDGESYPDNLYWSADHFISWAHRSRTQQTAGDLFDHFEGDIGPEPGTTYRVEGYAFVGDSTVEEQFLQTDVGSMTEWGMDSNLSEVDSNMGFPPEDSRTVTIKVWSVRDGYDSLQAAEVSFQVPPFTDSIGDSNA